MHQTTKSGTGAGICGGEIGQTISLQMRDYPTVFQSKISALMKCTQENLRLWYIHKEICIYSENRQH